MIAMRPLLGMPALAGERGRGAEREVDPAAHAVEPAPHALAAAKTLPDAACRERVRAVADHGQRDEEEPEHADLQRDRTSARIDELRQRREPEGGRSDVDERAGLDAEHGDEACPASSLQAPRHDVEHRRSGDSDQGEARDGEEEESGDIRHRRNAGRSFVADRVGVFW